MSQGLNCSFGVSGVRRIQLKLIVLNFVGTTLHRKHGLGLGSWASEGKKRLSSYRHRGCSWYSVLGTCTLNSELVCSPAHIPLHVVHIIIVVIFDDYRSRTRKEDEWRDNQ